MLKLCLLLRCAPPIIATGRIPGGAMQLVPPVTVEYDTVLQKLATVSLMSPPEAVAFAAELVTSIKDPATHCLSAVCVLEHYNKLNIRHEGVMEAAAWKAFKASLPRHVSPVETRKIVAAVATAFKIVAEQRFIHDHQLVVAAIGKSIECTPYMEPSEVASVFSALRHLNRVTFSVAESNLYKSDLSGERELRDQRLDPPKPIRPRNVDGLVNGGLRGHQAHGIRASLRGNVRSRVEVKVSDEEAFEKTDLVEVLCRALEQRIVERQSSFTGAEIVACIEAMQILGVSSKESVEALAAAALRVELQPHQITKLLTAVTNLHERVIDVLDHAIEGDEALRNLCIPLFTSIAKRLDTLNINAVAKEDPRLIVALRQLCERNSAVNEKVPQLWEKIRAIRVASIHARNAPERGNKKRVSGKLESIRTTTKKWSALDDPSYAHRFIPPPFKNWRGNVKQERHLLAPKVPRVQRFGSKRIPSTYLKETRQKWMKSASSIQNWSS